MICYLMLYHNYVYYIMSYMLCCVLLRGRQALSRDLPPRSAALLPDAYSLQL